jgi:Domain of unknown function (DUF4461)
MQARNDLTAAKAQAAMWASREENMTRLFLQRTRGVSISFGGGLPKHRGESISIDRLRSCLDRNAATDLGGLAIVLDGGASVGLHSPTATLTLGLCASDTQWDNIVHSEASKAAAVERRALAAAERRAARAVGVLHVLYQGHAYGMRHVDDVVAQRNYVTYCDVIQGLAAGRVAIDRVENLSVVLVGDSDDGEGATVEWDDREGVIRMGIRAQCEGVVEVIRRVGVGVSERHGRIVAAAEAEKAMVWRVARALRVSVVRRGEGITQRQWEHALGELLKDAGRLGGILDRSDIVVGADARLLSTGEVQVPWNFSEVLAL